MSPHTTHLPTSSVPPAAELTEPVGIPGEAGADLDNRLGCHHAGQGSNRHLCAYGAWPIEEVVERNLTVHNHVHISFTSIRRGGPPDRTYQMKRSVALAGAGAVAALTAYWWATLETPPLHPSALRLDQIAIQVDDEGNMVPAGVFALIAPKTEPLTETDQLAGPDPAMCEHESPGTRCSACSPGPRV